MKETRNMNTTNEQPQPQNAPSPGPCSSARALMVLVVDDEPGFRSLLQWELSHQGIQVEIAENGVEGAALAEKTKFDVIITDITMPKMDGLKLLRTIKAHAPDTEVIVATGFGAVETAVYAMQNGAFDFVLKPYDLEHLVARIKDAVELLRCGTCGQHTQKKAA